MSIPEFEELFNSEEIKEVIEDLRDPVIKEIGDRVVINDYSSCTHLNGRELDTVEDEEMQFNALTYFIVIDTDIKHFYNAIHVTYQQDLIIVNPLTKKQFRINSGHVKLK